MDDNKEYTQTLNQIKISALNIAKASNLSARDKAKLFDDVAWWALHVSERILLTIDIDNAASTDNTNQ